MENFVMQLQLVQWFEAADISDTLGRLLAKLWWISGWLGPVKNFVAVMVKFRVNDALLWVLD